jgi:hypothetical protein
MIHWRALKVKEVNIYVRKEGEFLNLMIDNQLFNVESVIWTLLSEAEISDKNLC